ncbi:MAG TPA: DUF1206 domain-containing protein [Gaiellaceae bacterium]
MGSQERKWYTALGVVGTNAQYGQVLLGTVAAGPMAYGLFCLVQARYREV